MDDSRCDGARRADSSISGIHSDSKSPDLPPPEDSDSPSDAALRSPLYRTIAVSHEWVADLEQTLNFDVEAFLTQLYELADSFGGQMMEGLLQLVSDTADDAGQVIDASDIDFFDAVIEAAERLEFTFDDDGNHGTTILIHPDTAKKIAERKPTPAQEARMAEVMARKREEWHAARSRRELP